MPPRKKNEAGTIGLRLTLPGAPATWHHLPDHGVWAHPVHPTPVGVPGGVPKPVAEVMVKDGGCPVEEVPVEDVDAALLELENHIRGLRALPPLAELPRAGAGAEGAVLDEQTNQEMEA